MIRYISIFLVLIIISSSCQQVGKKEEKKFSKDEKAILDSIKARRLRKKPTYDTARLGRPDSLMKFPTILKFEKEHFELGTVKEGKKITQKVIYTNEGKNPLIIFSAHGSCGCTVPQYKKEPLQPGASDTLLFTFNSTGKKGNNTKTVTILANTDPPANTFKFSVKVK